MTSPSSKWFGPRNPGTGPKLPQSNEAVLLQHYIVATEDQSIGVAGMTDITGAALALNGLNEGNRIVAAYRAYGVPNVVTSLSLSGRLVTRDVAGAVTTAMANSARNIASAAAGTVANEPLRTDLDGFTLVTEAIAAASHDDNLIVVPQLDIGNDAANLLSSLGSFELWVWSN